MIQKNENQRWGILNLCLKLLVAALALLLSFSAVLVFEKVHYRTDRV